MTSVFAVLLLKPCGRRTNMFLIARVWASRKWLHAFLVVFGGSGFLDHWIGWIVCVHLFS